MATTDSKKQNNTQMYFLQNILFHFIEWFKRLWVIILVLAVLGAAGMSFLTYARFEPLYNASATFTVNVDVKESSAQSYNKATAQQLAKTFPNILTSSSLNKVVCSDLGISNLSATITASALEDTNLFTITVKDSDAQRAYDVLQSVIVNYPQVARFVIGSTQLSLIDTSSVSTMPINVPNYPQKAILGMLAGAFAGLMLIFLFSMLTNTIIRSEDFSTYFNTRCLGSVAELNEKKRSSKKEDIPNIQNVNVNYKFREGIFTIRNTVIRKCREKGYKSIVVTSTLSGEGKSVIALNLAKSIALKGYKTCLVDFDLRVPSICGYMDIDNDIHSVTDYIKGDTPFESCVYSTKTDNFYIAIEKNNNADASELVGDDKAKEFIANLCKAFEFVIIDSPPTGYLADATVIGDYVDAAVYVVAQDVCSKRSVGNGLQTFDSVNAEVLGCVLNRITKGTESANYGKYFYQRYGRYGGRYSKGYYTKHHYASTKSDESEIDASVDIDISNNGIEFED